MAKIFREKFFILFKCFSAKSFGFKILNLYLFLKCLLNSKKIVFWEFIFGLKILYLFGDFPK